MTLAFRTFRTSKRSNLHADSAPEGEDLRLRVKAQADGEKLEAASVKVLVGGPTRSEEDAFPH